MEITRLFHSLRILLSSAGNTAVSGCSLRAEIVPDFYANASPSMSLRTKLLVNLAMGAHKVNEHADFNHMKKKDNTCLLEMARKETNQYQVPRVSSMAAYSLE
jgi:hypothetical protein